ncbi:MULTISPECIES: hypothetical protein [Marinobacter]|uniref:Secreted protein n=1 Tax=Marinobacter nauticus (strain ATCC 700491 / DSM 11845 / VT8) TaxID=351348 RepID=A1U7P8_MARN8|nr:MULTISPECIES: hypothetical protein [Marinobacter]ABM21017.1 hypothetical protein Maqu_4165 [Marinobacter nauticus VT8]
MTTTTRNHVALALVLAPLISATPALGQEHPPSAQEMTQQIIQRSCESYGQSLVSAIRTTAHNLSDRAMLERNQVTLNRVDQQKTIRSILEGIIESEPDAASRQIITNAANDYLRSGRIESFERGLTGLTSACIKARANPQASPSTPQTIEDAPAPNREWRYRDDNQEQTPEQPRRSTLPSRDSYL